MEIIQRKQQLKCLAAVQVLEHCSCEAFKFLFSLNNLPGCVNNKANVACFNSHVRQTILNDCFLLGLYEILIPCTVLREMEVIIEFAIK